MKKLQPILIIPFWFIVLVWVLGFCVIANVLEMVFDLIAEIVSMVSSWLGSIVSMAFLALHFVLECLFVILTIGGGVAFIYSGLNCIIRAFTHKQKWITPYMLLVSVGLMFGFSVNVPFGIEGQDTISGCF